MSGNFETGTLDTLNLDGSSIAGFDDHYDERQMSCYENKYCDPKCPDCNFCSECSKATCAFLMECFYSCGLERCFNFFTCSGRRPMDDRQEDSNDSSTEPDHLVLVGISDEEPETYIKYCAIPRECCEPMGRQCSDCRFFLYGKDYSETEEGRMCICKFGGCDKSTEHKFLCIYTAICSTIDLGLDITLVIKWTSEDLADILGLTHRDHADEAYMLLAVIGISNFISFIVSLIWKTGEIGFDGRREIGPGQFEFDSILHLIGLGVVSAAYKYREDYTSNNPIKNLGIFRWIEMLFENCPALMITLYVSARDQYKIEDSSGDDHIFTLESIAIIWSLCSMAYGIANFLTNQVPMAKTPGYARNIGQRGICRTITNTLLTLSDMILRQAAVVLFIVLYDSKYSFWWAFLLFGGLEVVLTIVGGQYYRIWQTVFIWYMCFFQGTVRYLARSWRRRDHCRTVFVFVLRYGFTIGIFAYFHASPEYPDFEMNWAWVYPCATSAVVLPIAFFLKPNTTTPFEAFDLLRRRSLMGNIAMRTMETMYNVNGESTTNVSGLDSTRRSARV